MGRWRITIDGVGCHHNGRREIDADLAAKDFVSELRKQGHTLEAARFEQLGLMEGDEEKRVYYASRVNPDAEMNIDLLAATAPATDSPGTGEAKSITTEQFQEAAGTGG